MYRTAWPPARLLTLRRSRTDNGFPAQSRVPSHVVHSSHGGGNQRVRFPLARSAPGAIHLADDQLSAGLPSGWPRSAAPGGHERAVTALQLFGIVPLEPGMNSPVDGTSLVGFRSIAAVVAPVAYRRQDPTDESITSYADVVEKVFEHMPILPAPPGAIFRSRSVISRWLELHYVALTDALGALEGNAAARVTIRLDEAPLTDETLKEWQALATESLRMLRGQATAISSQSEDGESEPAPSVLARTSFLIPRDRWPSFQSSVRAEAARHPHLEFTVTGPWPPYDFVRMQFGT
jgi:hypothetical protein